MKIIYYKVTLIIIKAKTDITFYVNGEIVGTGTHAGGIFSSTSDLVVGWQTNLDNSSFNGGIDEVRIWDHARTAEEIRANRNKLKQNLKIETQTILPIQSF